MAEMFKGALGQVGAWLNTALGSWHGFTASLTAAWHSVTYELQTAWNTFRSYLISAWEGMKREFPGVVYAWGGQLAQWAIRAIAVVRETAAAISDIWQSIINAISDKLAEHTIRTQVEAEVLAKYDGKTLSKADADILATPEIQRKTNDINAAASAQVDKQQPGLSGKARRDAVDAIAQPQIEKTGKDTKENYQQTYAGKKLDDGAMQNLIDRQTEDALALQKAMEKQRDDDAEKPKVDQSNAIQNDAQKQIDAVIKWSDAGLKEGSLDHARDAQKAMSGPAADQAALDKERAEQIKRDRAALSGMLKLSDVYAEAIANLTGGLISPSGVQPAAQTGYTPSAAEPTAAVTPASGAGIAPISDSAPSGSAAQPAAGVATVSIVGQTPSGTVNPQTQAAPATAGLQTPDAVPADSGSADADDDGAASTLQGRKKARDEFERALQRSAAEAGGDLGTVIKLDRQKYVQEQTDKLNELGIKGDERAKDEDLIQKGSLGVNKKDDQNTSRGTFNPKAIQSLQEPTGSPQTGTGPAGSSDPARTAAQPQGLLASLFHTLLGDSPNQDASQSGDLPAAVAGAGQKGAKRPNPLLAGPHSITNYKATEKGADRQATAKKPDSNPIASFFQSLIGGGKAAKPTGEQKANAATIQSLQPKADRPNPLLAGPHSLQNYKMTERLGSIANHSTQAAVPKPAGDSAGSKDTTAKLLQTTNSTLQKIHDKLSAPATFA